MLVMILMVLMMILTEVIMYCQVIAITIELKLNAGSYFPVFRILEHLRAEQGTW